MGDYDGDEPEHMASTAEEASCITADEMARLNAETPIRPFDALK